MKPPSLSSHIGALFVALLFVGQTVRGQTRTHGGAVQTPGRVPVKPGESQALGIHQTFHDKDKKLIKEVYQVKDTVRNVPHGRYVSYFLSGRMESRGQFLNNETSGVWEFYYETGKLKMRGILFKGENYGMWEYFFESGQKNMEGIINKRDREGEWKWFYENGQPKETGNYVKNQRDGYWKTYFEDGVLKGEINYDQDHGRYIEYDHAGKVHAEGPKAGALNVGHWRYFAQDGSLQSEGDFTAGRRSGEWTTYFPSGKAASRGVVVNDQPTGTWEYWHENGVCAGKGSFENGRKAGKWSTFSTDGKVISEIIYAEGRGQYVEYYQNGKLKARGLMQDEKREGVWEFYYETGEREGTCSYKTGKGLYYGYNVSGTLHTKGPMDGELKTGTWEIYEEDGKLSGYYKPFYDDKQLSAEITGLAARSQIAHKHPAAAAATHNQIKLSARRNTGYFTPRYNEVQGVILGTNPVWLAAGQLPVGIEFYLQERLGHEFEFIGIRDPFFTADSEVVPGKRYQRGYSIAIKQKFYNPLNVGMWYFGQEIRFTNVGHFVNEIDPHPASMQNVFTFNATEQRVEWGVLLGYRLMRRGNAGGLTVDAFVSADLGYRNFDVDDVNAHRFTEIPQHSFSSTFHFGLNLGNVFSFR